jgi:hypothetical protein
MFKHALSFALLYSALILIYMIVQEVYVQTCTWRSGISQMIFTLPVCNHLVYVLHLLGDDFIRISLLISGVIFTFLHK